MTNESMIKLMQMSMDELEKRIAESKKNLQFMQDVFSLREKAGERTTKQLEREEKRKAKSRPAIEPVYHNENGVS